MVTLRSIAVVIASTVLLAHPSSAHSIKRDPLSYITSIDDVVIKTPSHRLHSHSNFDLTFALHHGRQKIRLVLHPNDDLIHADFGITFLGHDGNVRAVERVPRTEHRVYKGDAFIERPGLQGWSKAGWARITVHRDGQRPVFDGAFRVDGDNHHVQTARQYLRLRGDEDPMIDVQDGEESMVVWRDSDVGRGHHMELKRSTADGQLCEADALDFNSNFHTESQSPTPLQAISLRSLFGRQSIDDSGGVAGVNLINSIGSLDGCPTTRKVALVGIATDCTYWDGFNSRQEIWNNVIGMVNKASEMYESTFKISLAIQNITVSDKTCPGTPSPSAPWNVGCSSETTITNRLSSFSQWRGQFQDDNAYWSLLTRCGEGSGTVGLAWRGQLCRQGSGINRDQNANETVSSTNIIVRTDTEWQVFAHESGHTFGAIHDCTDSTCPVDANRLSCCPVSKSSCDAAGKFIMNPSTGRSVTQFSPCSIGNICSGLKSNLVKSNCLTDNKNVKTFTGSQCGNGIVESGEDCDCGGEQGCKGNKCCDAKTCKFATNAVCDPTNEDCCTEECRFASRGTVCRASTGVCDPGEVCPGDGAGCPDDEHKKDGDSCGDGLSCASGQCTSRDMQCKSMTSSPASGGGSKACPGSSCMLACTSSDMGPGQCIVYSHPFLDGTPCGGGGRCVNGACEGSSVLNEIGEWIKDHKAIFIPVVSVVGGLILIALVSCIVGSIRRHSRRRKLPNPPEMTSWPPYNGQGGGRRARSHQQQQGSESSGAILAPNHSQGEHVDSAQGHYAYPAPPRPDYPQQWFDGHQQSTRYA